MGVGTMTSDIEARRRERGYAHIRKIMAEVAERHSVPVHMLKAKRRAVRLVLARQEAMYLAVMNTSASLPMIGRELERHHTTILHGARQHEARITGA